MLRLKKIGGPRSFHAPSTRWHGSHDFLCTRHCSGISGKFCWAHQTMLVFRPILHKRWTCGMNLGGLQMQNLQLPTKIMFNVGNHLKYCSIYYCIFICTAWVINWSKGCIEDTTQVFQTRLFVLPITMSNICSSLHALADCGQISHHLMGASSVWDAILSLSYNIFHIFLDMGSRVGLCVIFCQ